jgi:hypothetical protein
MFSAATLAQPLRFRCMPTVDGERLCAVACQYPNRPEDKQHVDVHAGARLRIGEGEGVRSLS